MVDGGVAAFASIEVGGIDLDVAVQGLVRRYDLAVPLGNAERIKHEIGSALDDRTGASSWIRGRRVSDGTVRTVGIPANEVHSAAKHMLTGITDLVNDTLDQAPHGCVDDIIATRIRLVGGGALLPGLAPLILHRTGIRTRVADRPRHAAVLGSAPVGPSAGLGRVRTAGSGVSELSVVLAAPAQGGPSAWSGKTAPRAVANGL